LCSATFIASHSYDKRFSCVPSQVVRPYVAPQSANFVTVKGDGWPDNGFFQAFLATTKGNPIIRQSLDIMLNLLWDNNRHYLGPISLMNAWLLRENVTAKNYTKASNIDVHLLAEVNMNQPNAINQYTKLRDLLATKRNQMMQNVPRLYEYGDECRFSSGACNIIVLDETDESVYFYSRLLGTTWCGKMIQISKCAASNEEARDTDLIGHGMASERPKPPSDWHDYALRVRKNISMLPDKAPPQTDDNVAHGENVYHALGGRENILLKPQPPAEELWLLSSPANLTQNMKGPIPKIINRIYFQKDGRYPAHVSDQIKQAHKTWEVLNPGYQIRYFNLMSARRYLHKFFHPVFLRAFDCIEAFAGKSDFFRMTLLYRETVCLQQHLLDRIANSTNNFWASLDFGGGFVRKSVECHLSLCFTSLFGF
jgi:hypothetical protein